MGLGDAIEGALSSVGITEERVSAWLGAPCACKERKAKLNRLGSWARKLIAGKMDTGAAAAQLEGLLQSTPQAEGSKHQFSTLPVNLNTTFAVPPTHQPKPVNNAATCTHGRPVSTVSIDRSTRPFVVTMKVLCRDCGLPFTIDGQTETRITITDPVPAPAAPAL